tara:strand:+ start:1731 stop:4139 length:2409 start_codon:yes stop_codon:yes gene_type:complete
MSDEDKKNLEEVISEDVKDQSSENEKNPQEVTEDQPKVESDVNLDQSKEIDNKEKKITEDIKEVSDLENQETSLIEQNNENVSSDEEKQEKNKVVHKKDGRLHIYVRQDRYKGELKSKNWVGRLYIDGKQKIFSSGTQNLDDAIPILEKWFDDILAESEKQKKQAEEQKTLETQTPSSAIETTPHEETPPSTIQPPSPEKIETQNLEQTTIKSPIQNEEITEDTKPKNKIANIFGKLKNIKLKTPSLKGIKLPQSSKKTGDNAITKFFEKVKSKIGKSSIQGEEIIGVELNNKEIRLAQISLNKSNQWVLEKFFTHKVELPDESSVIDNAEKFAAELTLALQKIKLETNNVAISIPVTSAIIRVVTAPLMKDEELQKAIDTNSLWENLVQLTDNLDDYSIFHQVINRNDKENTMDILFVASKLTDINSYVSIVKNSGLNPVIIDVKCFALKSAVDQINQITNKPEDANLTAVLEFGLDENYLMILYDNNPIITDIFLRGLDRKILLESENVEEKEGLVRRYGVQVKQAIQDFETKYEKRIRNIKVVSDINNVEEYLSYFRKSLMNVGFNLFDPISGLKVPQQFDQQLNLENRSYLTTSIGLAFRKLDVFGYYKFVTAAKNINLLPNRKNMFQQKKMKAISSFAFKGLAGGIAAIYLILFALSFWNIHSYNKKLQDYNNVKVLHEQKSIERKKAFKELKVIQTTLKLSKTLKSNKELTYRVLAQIASSVPSKVKFDQVDYTGGNMITVQGIAASDQDILKFIENLGKQNLIGQASLSSMRLPQRTQGGASMKGFRVFVKIKES